MSEREPACAMCGEAREGATLHQDERPPGWGDPPLSRGLAWTLVRREIRGAPFLWASGGHGPTRWRRNDLPIYGDRRRFIETGAASTPLCRESRRIGAGRAVAGSFSAALAEVQTDAGAPP
jgi:hypothetical protein